MRTINCEMRSRVRERGRRPFPPLRREGDCGRRLGGVDLSLLLALVLAPLVLLLLLRLAVSMQASAVLGGWEARCLITQMLRMRESMRPKMQVSAHPMMLVSWGD